MQGGDSEQLGKGGKEVGIIVGYNYKQGLLRKSRVI